METAFQSAQPGPTEIVYGISSRKNETFSGPRTRCGQHRLCKALHGATTPMHSKIALKGLSPERCCLCPMKIVRKH